MNTIPEGLALASTKVIRSMTLCHSKAKRVFIETEQEFIAANKAGLTKARFEVFETFRHPMRQEHLFAANTTKARAWQSAHQYGLAVDFVPRLDGRWTWLLSELGDTDMLHFRRIVGNHGLIADIAWDPFHCEHPLWRRVKEFLV